MGLRRAWLAECDASCSRRIVIREYFEADARASALERGWMTVLRAGPGGTVTAWLCPLHNLADATPATWEEEHEDWCPKAARGGPCACRPDIRPHMHDDTVYQLPRRPSTHVVKVSEEYL